MGQRMQKASSSHHLPLFEGQTWMPWPPRDPLETELPDGTCLAKGGMRDCVVEFERDKPVWSVQGPCVESKFARSKRRSVPS